MSSSGTGADFGFTLMVAVMLQAEIPMGKPLMWVLPDAESVLSVVILRDSLHSQLFFTFMV